MTNELAPTKVCTHTDGYGSTIMADGLCLLCDRTPGRDTVCKPTKHRFSQLDADSMGRMGWLYCQRCGTTRNIR